MSRSTIRFHREAGVTLFVVLAFLIMMTLMGIAAFGLTTTEEKLARNFRDRSLAFAAAEAAIRDGVLRVTGEWTLGKKFDDGISAPTTVVQLSPLVNTLFTGACTHGGLCADSIPVTTSNMVGGVPVPTVSDFIRAIENFGHELSTACAPIACDGSSMGGAAEYTGSPPFMPDVVSRQPKYTIIFSDVGGLSSVSGLANGGASGGGGKMYKIRAVGYGARAKVLLEYSVIR